MELKVYFQGRWELNRLAVDRSTDSSTVMIGCADFISTSLTQLRYHESGSLQRENYQGPFERTYLYVFPTEKSLKVFFEDGRFFYEADVLDGCASFVHYCGNDVYEGSMTLSDARAFEIEWQIHGPKKALQIRTQYTR